jgi:hypothetical protein
MTPYKRSKIAEVSTKTSAYVRDKSVPSENG